ncbi:hypothetical protein B9Z55_003487 [Caenorhabditis nigoni]|uniref:Uncharacterized protein n=1 Tax=Caenorhabditis nigoni TaxID=1611254 RepID=A0A2G5VQM3_9PELO|nr:hypothetical protein B9Z55_003487 [Caenorhabditis nigoni]
MVGERYRSNQQDPSDAFEKEVLDHYELNRGKHNVFECFSLKISGFLAPCQVIFSYLLLVRAIIFLSAG